ncbi:Crp/Fnr family transcriptional regulator [Pedobacter sp. BS3]|uniref:Crp/Fnr family transcriptional regulator n=1 Tax=Pedobacter sp. BS3 TaxID=2567937 RepID=UPI0011ED9341|nr:Crp/Fnr family transcriptional regulator [Pedobacter sp. BS3]TZF82080.1 Crp/Fnr family transcriptional regulator [Pedobacter sp. BS3]
MKEHLAECDLKRCFLCKHALPDWLPAIGAHKKSFDIKKGQQLFKEGDPVTGIYFVYSGSLKVHKRWDKEKELITRFAKEGDILGHMGLGDEAFYPVSATALEPSVVCFIGMDFFESTLRVNTELTYRLMRFFASELQKSEKRMRNLAHMSVKARIAQSFITLKNQFGLDEDGYIRIELTRQDIASFAGASYETLFKVINELTASGIIGITGKKIVLLNEAQLLRLVEEDNL